MSEATGAASRTGVGTVDLPPPVHWRDEDPRRDALYRDLVAAVDGEVRVDAGSRAAYSTDSSNYRQPPIAVVVPRSVQAAEAAVAVCRRHRAPVVSRGGGTSLAGQTTNDAVVIDWTKYCNRLVSVDEPARTCVVEPGIALDDLNDQLADRGLMFGPRPSTHPSCTIGGMVGNNSCGATAQAYGKTVDNVNRLEVLTYDGARMWVGATGTTEYEEIVAGTDRRAVIYRELRALRDAHLAGIRTRFPDIPRRVSGYNLDALLPERGFDVAQALVGSEGTLVTVLHAELRLVPLAVNKTLVVLGYPDIAAAGDAVPRVLRHDPWQLEGLDDVLIGLERADRVEEKAISGLPPGRGWLMVQFIGDSPEESEARARGLLDDVGSGEPPPHAVLVTDEDQEVRLAAVREAGLGATAHPSAKHDTWEGWEDSAVPPDRLGDYLRDLRALFEEFGYVETTSLYGHFGQGCVHTRIPFELRTADGIARYRRFVERAADLVVSYGGSLSGEHGDGQSRGELLVKMYGAEVVRGFEWMKKIFDPLNMMNPGKVVAPYPLDANLKLGTGYEPREPRTHFAFPKDENRFSRAASRCVGVGNCRSSGGDGQVMCPSYQVTREETHSTRGRARLLFEMVRGEVITDGWRSTEVRDALDLCLSCKGCRSDCPVEVDMATYKAEFLSHHYAGRRRPASHYSMGWLPLWARLAAVSPGSVNFVGRSPMAPLVKRLGGIALERDLPQFAAQRFTDWFHQREARQPGSRGPVLLWPDTFTNNFDPHIGVAAVQVLEDAGFEVRLPDRSLCCGLTWISTGQLGIAKRVLRHTVATLRDEIRAGIPLVGLEPSCTAVFRADAPELLAGDEDVRRLSMQTVTLAEVLTRRAPDWRPPPVNRQAIVQTHCHQHAVMGFQADRELLERVGVEVDVLDSGCCGLAGNFGFERGHFEVSLACAERVLLPAVRRADRQTVLVADGFSCRTQVEQARTGRQGVHLAELLASAVRGTQLGDRPEDAVSAPTKE